MSIILVIWLGCIDIIKGNMSSGQIVSFIYFAIIVGISTGGIAETISELQGPLASLEKIYKLQNLSSKTYNNSNKKIDWNNFNLNINKVNFSYPIREDTTVLNNLIMNIQAKGFYAFVGKSGSGKSTLLQLLIRLYDIHSGEIEIAGNNINSIHTNILREKIAYVPQDPIIFSGSIRDNIAFSKPNAHEEEILTVAKLTLVDEFVKNLPQK